METTHKNTVPSLETKRTTNFLIGLTLALAFVFTAFEWKTYQKFDREYFDEEMLFSKLEEEILPITQTKQTPPPPPPPRQTNEFVVVSKTKELHQNHRNKAKQIEPISIDDILNSQIPEQINETATLASSSPLRFASEMPVFPDCEHIESKTEREQCSYDAIHAFIARNAKFPEQMIKAGISGKLYLNFVIDKNGEVKDIKVVRGIPDGEELSQSAIRSIKKLPKMRAGRHHGKKVSVLYTVPVNFSLRE